MPISVLSSLIFTLLYHLLFFWYPYFVLFFVFTIIIVILFMASEVNGNRILYLETKEIGRTLFLCVADTLYIRLGGSRYIGRSMYIFS